MAPIHPGEVLPDVYLLVMGITQYRLAKRLGVAPRRVNEIEHGKRAISADTGLCLARFLDMVPESWLHLQAHSNLEFQRSESEARIEREVDVFRRTV